MSTKHPLISELKGRYVEKGDDGYEAARMARVFSTRRPDRYPAAILFPRSEDDVISGLRLAKNRGWQVGVRSGAHSFPVWGVRDDALLIDFADFKEIGYDAETHIASVTPSVEGGAELNEYLKSHGRMFAGGRCPTVGVAGFLLQGGIGWNFRGWGWAVERLVAVDVVTADGELVRADEVQNADLFWAARGCGPGFPGIITRLHIHTRAIPRALMYTRQFYPVEHYAEILEWLSAAQKNMHKDIDVLAMSIQPEFELPGHSGGFVFGVSGVAFSDTAEEGAKMLEPFADNPLVEKALLVEPPTLTTLDAEYAFVDSVHPPNRRYRVESAWVDGDYAEIARASQTLVRERPVGEAGYTFFQYALPHEGPDMAQALKTDLMVGAYIIYNNAADDDFYRQWTLDAMAPLEPFTVGQYWGDSDQEHRAVRCLTDAAWDRLQTVREVWDSAGLFVDYLAGPGGFQNVNGWASS